MSLLTRQTAPLLILAATSCAFAGAPPIATDRPAVTDSSIVVPAGTLQAENGFAVTAANGATTYDLPETLLRFGISAKTELRFTTPDYFAGSPGPSGFGGLAFGFKRQLGPIAGFDVSLVAATSLPTRR